MRTKKPTLSTQARAALAQALKAMRARPDTFDMDNWITHDPDVKGKEPLCGTTACIAGHVAIAATGKTGDAIYRASDGTGHTEPMMYATARLPKWIKDSLDGEARSRERVGADDVAGAILGIGETYDRERSAFVPSRNGAEATLFMLRGWPKRFQKRYYLARRRGDATATAAIAIARVRHWLKTGK